MADEITVSSETLEKLDEIGANGLDWLQEFSTSGIGFIEEQAPLVCNEIVRWGIFNALFIAGVFLLITLLCVFIWRKAHVFLKQEFPNGKRKNGCDMTSDDCCFCMLCWGVPMVATLSVSIGIWVNLYHALYVAVAPRLYLLEYFTELAAKVTGGGG